MGNDTIDAQKDDLEQKDSHLKLKNTVNLSDEDELLKLENSLSQKNLQHTLVSNNGKWLQIVKNSHKGSFFRGTRIVDSKIPRHVVSLDEKYLRRCLELILISASKTACSSLSVKMGISSYQFDSPVITRESILDVPQGVFELPLAGGSGSTIISPMVGGYKSILQMLNKPLLHNSGALDIDSYITRKEKHDVKGLISCDGSSQSQNICADSISYSSDLSSSSSSSTISQGILRFTMNANGMPYFVFSLDDRKERFVARLSNAESGFNKSALQHTYLIHLEKGNGNESHLIGKIKVSTLFSVSSSSSNCRIMEREFVLFSDNLQIQCHDTKKNKGLPKKVVDVFKNTRTSRQRSNSRFSRANSIVDWEPFQEQSYDLDEPVNLLENDLPPNLESLAIVVKEEIQEEQPKEVFGGWGMKFLKKPSFNRTDDISESSKPSTSMVVIVPSGIHGGPRKTIIGPYSLIQRWKSGGICDCGGWDLGCPLTVLNGKPRKHQCNLFEFFTEGSRSENPELRVDSVYEGLYLVQIQKKISALQAFTIAIAYIHSQSKRLRPESVHKLKFTGQY